MDIRTISRQDLVVFLRKLPPTPGSFLQGPWWYDLVQNPKDRVSFLAFFNGRECVGVATTVTREVRKGFAYTYVPRGPLMRERGQLTEALGLLRDYWQGSAFCLRVEPVIAGDTPVGPGRDFADWEDFPKGYRSVAEVQPCASSALDISRSEAELLKGMHQKTRYNLHLAERKDLIFRWGSAEDFQAFWGLLQGTAERGKFRTHAFTHYHELLKTCEPTPFSADKEFELKLGLVEHHGKLLAACLNVASLGVVTYLHGASDRAQPELMAPYMLHWRVIQAAQAAGFKRYDWWGVRTERSGTSSWEGFTRFKMRFGGPQLEYLGTFDYPFKLATYYSYLVGHLVDTAMWRMWHVLRKKT